MEGAISLQISMRRLKWAYLKGLQLPDGKISPRVKPNHPQIDIKWKRIHISIQTYMKHSYAVAREWR